MVVDELFANSGDPALGLHCFQVIRLGVSSLQWVKVHFVVRVCKPVSSTINANKLISWRTGIYDSESTQIYKCQGPVVQK